MANPTWGTLEKSAVDNETIEEAIDRIVSVHNSDPTSHLGVDGSLLAHKEDEVIDHPAQSILNDKFAFDTFKFESWFDTLDGWTISGNATLEGFASVEIQTNDVLHEYTAMIMMFGNPNGLFLDMSQPIYWTSTHMLEVSGAGEVMFGPISEDLIAGYGFIYQGSQMKVVYCTSDEVAHYTNISLPDETKMHKWSISYVPGVALTFYVDDVAVATIASLTLTVAVGTPFVYRIYNTDAHYSYMELRYCACTGQLMMS